MKGMKKATVQIPMAGVYEFTGMFDEELSHNEIIELVVNNYNNTSSTTNLYPVMISGAGIKYPLNFARVVE